MNYGYKVTVSGRELLAALLATGKELEITRVAIGSGKVAEDQNLADMTGLINYVANGAVAQRRHVDNVFYMTVQYASNFTPGLGAFYLSEFIVEAKHPVNGASTPLLYATLGDYIQPVKAYSETEEPDIRNYPIVMAISDEISVTVSAPAGLVTYDDLQESVDKAFEAFAAGVGSAINADITIPAAGWAEHGLTDAEHIDHPYAADVAVDGCTAKHFPVMALARSSLKAAGAAGMAPSADTFSGFVRFYAKRVPAADLTGTIQLRSENLNCTGGGCECPDTATDEEVKTEVIEGIFGVEDTVNE